jgi:lipoprotein-anchoring transpeptidase ErfK/SrfK
MRKKNRRIVAGVGLFLMVASVSGYFIYKAPEPPLDGMKMALEALSEAKKAEAPTYAREVYRKAEQAYDSAMTCWAVENERFFLFRDYTDVSKWIAVVIDKADEAQTLSGSRARSTASRLKEGIAQLGKKAAAYEEYYKHLPLPANVSKAHHKGVMKLSEAKFAWQNNRFGEAEKNYKQANDLITDSNQKAERLVTTWFDGHDYWQRQARQAIEQSAGGKKVIIVDKLAHTCTVYQNRKAIKTFDAELGINWMGDKKWRGDKATPEGNYRVTKKKSGAETKFNKALLIDYPNDEDRDQFQKAKKNGSIPARADIGGLIEIHGGGGKGVDWTDGCVALSDEDMESLYKLVSVGTPVVIVGSLLPLDAVLAKSQK